VFPYAVPYITSEKKEAIDFQMPGHHQQSQHFFNLRVTSYICDQTRAEVASKIFLLL
jgi:hypothetical protein